MGSRKSSRARPAPPLGYITMVAAVAACATPASAQELKFQFNNPSFGGNPFNSAHLLAIATAQRPKAPTTTTAQSQTEIFARQLQSRLLSALSAGLVTAITGSTAGTTGEFQLGGQTISFENDGTNITVTIFDEATGETTVITVPVFNFTTPTPTPTPTPTTPRGSAEADLSGVASVSGGDLVTTSTLDTGTVELPISGSGF